jgi:protein-tyrosine-phosphatase
MSVQIFNSSRQKKELKVLFISKRDACRAPIAECIFKYLAEKYADRHFNRFLWRAGSAGMDVPNHHQGSLPEHKTLRVLCENQLDTSSGSRQVR